MNELSADGSISLHSMLDKPGGGDAAVAPDANRRENRHAGGRRVESAQTLPKEVIVSTPGSDTFLEYAFEVTGDLEKLEPDEDSGPAVDEVTDLGDRIRVEGGVSTGDDRFAFSGDLVRVDVPSGVQLDIRGRDGGKPETEDSGWRDDYQRYAAEYVPKFYESVPTERNLYRCVRYVGENSTFWETLGEKMYLSGTVVTAAYAYPLPNYGKVDEKAWDGILDDMYADMPEKYRRRDAPISIPVFVVYLYDGYYNAVAHLRPYGNYRSEGYAIKNGYRQRTQYDSKSDYESNTWWWTEDGWGDAGDTDGGILDGVPTRLVD